MGKKIKINHIVLMKVVALLLVILGNATILYSGDWKYTFSVKHDFFKWLTIFIYSFHIQLIVFISGYIYYFCNKECEKYGAFLNLISNKFKRLIIPYFLVAFLWMIPIYYIIGYYKTISLSTIFSNIVLSIRPEYLGPLLMLFIIFGVIHICNSFITKYKYISLFAFLFLSVISKNVVNLLQLSMVFKYLIYFYLGFLTRRYSSFITRYNKNSYLCFGIFIQIVLFCVRYCLGLVINPRVVNSIFYSLMDISIAIIAIYITYFICYRIVVRYHEIISSSRFIKILDQYSLEIYLLHQPILMCLVWDLQNVEVSPFIAVNIYFWLTLIISSIFAKCVFKSNLLKIVFGALGKIDNEERVTPIITFIDDDGSKETYSKLYPIFERKKVKFVTAISPNLINTVGYMTDENIMELNKHGYEIINHNFNHYAYYEIDDDSVWEEEIAKAKEYLKKKEYMHNIFVNPKAQGISGNALSIIRKYSKCAFNGVGHNYLCNGNRYNLKRIGFGSWTKEDVATFDYYKREVDYCLANNTWLVWMVHIWAQPLEQDSILCELIEYIQSKKIPIVTASEGFKLRIY